MDRRKSTVKRKRKPPYYPTLKINDYIKEMLKRSKKFKDGVLDGSIISSKYIKLQVGIIEKYYTDKTLWYNKESVDIAFKFFSFLRIPIHNRVTQFQLTDYQAFIVEHLFAWYYSDNEETRKYRYLIFFTARKSGKTMFAVSILLLLSYYDGEYDSETYLLGTTREQANQGFKYLRGVINNSPSLKKRTSIRRFDISHEISGEAIIKSLAAKAESLDSLNPNGAIIDEMHAHEDLELFNVIKSGTLSRDNPLTLLTSTAGFDKEYPFYGMLEQSKRDLEAGTGDESTLIMMFMLDEQDDFEDSSLWVKANPNLGYTIKLSNLVTEYKRAVKSPIELRNFKVKNLNMYLDSNEQWIPDEDYIKVFTPTEIGRMKGWKAWGGIDLASTRDLASLVWLLQDETGKFHVYPEFYFPNNKKNKMRKTGIDIGIWIDDGHIIQHDKKTIDYDKLYERIEFFNQLFDIQALGYDNWNSALLIPRVEMDFLIRCVSCPQNTSFFNFPLKYLEKSILDENINMSTNPVLRWNFNNVVLYFDGNGNVKIMKNKSKDSVDGAVALGMAMGMWLADNFSMEDLIYGDYSDMLNKNKKEEKDGIN